MMKKITILLTTLFVFTFSWQGMAQTLNQPANWPNTDWSVTTISTDNTQDIEADPSVDANFAYDDDDTGSGSHDEIMAESSVIDLTAAHTAGETRLTLSGEYVFNNIDNDEYLGADYWDADATGWVTFIQIANADTSGAPYNDYCGGTSEAYSADLDISGFTATQLSGFKYRFYYNDDTTGGSGYNYGFCFTSPTLISSTPPTDTPDWYNIQWIQDDATPPNGSNTSLTVDVWSTVTGYAQVYEPGVTDVAGQGAGIECWFGGNNENTDPSTWDEENWDVATYNGDAGDNDEYTIAEVLNSTGTVYVAARWRLNNGPYVYGAYNGPWDGTTNNSIELIINPVVANDDCSGAEALTVNADLECGTVTAGTTFEATESYEDGTTCYGTNNDDVWYSFVAAAETHQITIDNVVAVSPGSSVDMYFEILHGNCGALDSWLCSDDNTNSVSGLTIGDTYFVRVYSYFTSSSQTFDICVGTPSPPPANDNCDGATPYTDDFTMFTEGNCSTPNPLDLSSATDDIGNDDPSCDTYSPNAGVWYTWTATSTGLTFTSGTGDPGLAVYEAGTCGSLVQVGCLNNASGTISDLTIGNDYIFFIWDDTMGTSVDFCLEEYTPPPPPANDACADATVVTTLAYSMSQDASTATNNDGFISDCAYGMNDGVWYTFTVVTSGDITIVVAPTTAWDPELAVYTGSCGAFTCETSADDGGPSGDESVTFTGLAGTTYYINVGDWSGSTDNSEGPFDINITSSTAVLGIANQTIEGFNMFPNPVLNTLNLNAQNNIDAVNIYNMLGQEVLRSTPSATQVQLDMSSLPTGAYIVKVQAGAQLGSYNLIKQ